jgi:hypothetical protein
VSFARPTRQMHAHPAGQRVHQAGLLNCRTHVRSCLSVKLISVVATASSFFVPTPCDRLHMAPSLMGRALCRDIARSVHPRGAHPSPTLPRSVVLPSIVIPRLWLVIVQIIEFAPHRPDYERFFCSP